jgi:multisubunit Na+/H+ antiporter MnhE subunit
MERKRRSQRTRRSLRRNLVLFHLSLKMKKTTAMKIVRCATRLGEKMKKMMITGSVTLQPQTQVLGQMERKDIQG